MNDLEIFKSLKNIRVVFDIGARGTQYPSLKPKAEYHLFEPNPDSFNKLPQGDKIYSNNYGLGDVEGIFPYNNNLEAFGGSEALPKAPFAENMNLPVKTLDWYIETNNIKRIDFLKIDAEGMDYKILQGGKKAIELTRYIQVEYWDDEHAFDMMLKDFDIKNIGLRNLFCARREN